MRILIASVAAAVLFVVGSASTSLAASPNASITLEWTAPGDDSLTGRATQYDLRYSLIPILESNFATRTQVTGVPAPQTSGTLERFSVPGLTYGVPYYFAIKTADERGNWSRISNVVLKVSSGPVGTDDVPVVMRFSSPYPNPARNSTNFAITIPRETDVQIEAFDISGRLVRTLASGARTAGDETLVWDLCDHTGRPLGGGIYLVRARIGTQTVVRRVMVAR